MANIIVSKVALDATGALRVYLRNGGNYSYIYRAALSVRWDAADSSLYVLPVDGFTTVDEFNQISKAVRNEYGDELVVNAATRFEVSAEVAGKLQQAAA